jgi:hypothetical protein
MKYAVLSPRGRINRVTDKEPRAVPDTVTVAQITDEQFALIEAGRAATPPMFYFLVEGDLVTLQDKLAAERPYDVSRRDAYEAEGADAEALTVALWEKEEGRPAEWDRIQAIRTAIKARFPKP